MVGIRDDPLPPDAGATPAVSRARAMRIAAMASGMPVVYGFAYAHLEIPRWYRDFVPLNRLAWRVGVAGNRGDGFAYDDLPILIDGQTGEVLEKGIPGGDGRRDPADGKCLLYDARTPGKQADAILLKLPLRAHEERLWVPLRFAELFRVRVKVKGDRATLAVKGGRASGGAGSKVGWRALPSL